MGTKFEFSHDWLSGDPFVSEADVTGLYEPDVAVVVATTTVRGQGTGPAPMDDWSAWGSR